jgi:O-methyltransferase
MPTIAEVWMEYGKEIVKAALGTLAKRNGIYLRYADRELRKLYPDYEPVYPGATYSPWNRDEAFEAVYSRVKLATLVDKYRCFELWKLVEQVAKLESGAILEVGVWRGGTTALIAARANILGLKEKIYACDTFNGVVKAGAQDQYLGGEHADTSAASAENLIYATMKLNNVEILAGIFPEETGKMVENLKFRLCHIDVDVYKSAKDIADWIWDKVVPGGIVVYDDFGFHWCRGIALHVEEQMPLKDRIVLHNLNGHAIVIKR